MIKVIITLLFALIAVTCVSAQSQADSENRCELDIEFDVPEFIEEGLINGSMERVGGVIRYSEDQQTIAWLRQGGQIGQVADSSASLLEHVTRLSGHGHFALGRFVAGVTPILNIAMGGFSLLEHIIGIRMHEAELERIYDRVAKEFQRDRRVELLAALDHAENTLLVNNVEYKLAAVAEVNSDLAKARKQLIQDLDILLSAEMSSETMELAMNYQVLVMRVCALGTRLRLEIDEKEAATDWLSQCVTEQEDYTRKFVNKSLGDNRALYFHESVNDEYFERYLGIERWLRGQRVVLPLIVQAYRGSFWKDSSIGELYSGRVNRQLVDPPFYANTLPMAENLIENFQRLNGFEHELKSMCLPTFAEWDGYDGDDNFSIREHGGYVLLVKAAFLGTESDAGN